MGNNIKNCLECQKNQFWVEIRLVDELNKPFGSLTGTLKDATGNIHAVTLTGGYLLLTDLPAGPVELKLETKALLTEAKKHKPRPMPQTSPAKEYSDKNKGYQKSKMKYQYITLGDLWLYEPKAIPKKYKETKLLRIATNNSYILEMTSLEKLKLPVLIFKSKRPMDDYLLSDDMKCGDMSKEQILDLGKGRIVSFCEDDFRQSAASLFINIRIFSKPFAIYGESSKLAPMMIDHFERNIGDKFTHHLLDEIAKTHENTNAVVRKVSDQIKMTLNDRDGDLDNEDIKKIWNILANDKDGSIKLPGFDSVSDYVNGMVFCVHGLTALELTLTHLDVDLVNRRFKCSIAFKAQDHFGLDKKDVTEKGFEKFILFRAWFILQRWKTYGYKPFITEMNHTRDIEGIF
nr:DUF3289 family protein [uncultured Tolumonas sp.]